MGTNELRNLVESLMSNTSRTDDGITCPFCMLPQKQIINHIKKNHHTEMQENCRTEDYEPELKRYLQKIKDQKKIKKKKEADPDYYAKRQQKYRMQQLLMNPTEFRRKSATQNKEYLARLSHQGKARLVEYHKKWDRLNAARNKTFEAAKKRFHQEIKYGPIFPCVCCHGMYFRHQVVPYNGKLERKIRTEAKAAQMRNTKEKAAGEELVMQMKYISIHEEEEKEEKEEKEDKRNEEGKEEGKEEERRTDKQLAQQDHQNMLDGNELEEEQDKVYNAFQLYMNRADNIIATFEECRQKAVDADDVVCFAILDASYDVALLARNQTLTAWSSIEDNMNNPCSLEQMSHAKMLAEVREMKRTPQEDLLKLLQNLLDLMEDQDYYTPENQTLRNRMLEQIWEMTMKSFSGCNCEVKIFP